MREITAGELSKILKEHKRWLGTDEKEGKRADLREANLSDANLSGVIGLTVEQLSEVRTLYKAKIDPELMKQVKDEYPHLLKKPEYYEEEEEEE